VSNDGLGFQIFLQPVFASFTPLADAQYGYAWMHANALRCFPGLWRSSKIMAFRGESRQRGSTVQNRCHAYQRYCISQDSPKSNWMVKKIYWKRFCFGTVWPGRFSAFGQYYIHESGLRQWLRATGRRPMAVLPQRDAGAYLIFGFVPPTYFFLTLSLQSPYLLLTLKISSIVFTWQ